MKFVFLNLLTVFGAVPCYSGHFLSHSCVGDYHYIAISQTRLLLLLLLRGLSQKMVMRPLALHLVLHCLHLMDYGSAPAYTYCEVDKMDNSCVLELFLGYEGGYERFRFPATPNNAYF